MEALTISIIIASFLGLLVLNIYFRVKVFKYYKVLVKNRVEFNAKHVFNKQKMEEEIIPLYPKHGNDIRAFSANIRFSVKLAILLIGLITLMAMILKVSH